MNIREAFEHGFLIANQISKQTQNLNEAIENNNEDGKIKAEANLTILQERLENYRLVFGGTHADFISVYWEQLPQKNVKFHFDADVEEIEG